MSAALYLSFGLSFFAPLPLLIYAALVTRARLLLAILANAVIVYLVLGPTGIASFSIFVGVTALCIPYGLMQKKFSVEKTALLTLFGMFLVAGSLVLGYFIATHIDPLTLFKNNMDHLAALWLESVKDQVQKQDIPIEEVKTAISAVAPSVFVIFSILMIWANLIFFVRMNPKGAIQKAGVAPHFLRHWRAPEWLVWPTIASGAVLLLIDGSAGVIALNFALIFLAIYALQGISILVFFFDAWRLGPFLRVLVFFFVLTSLWPMLIGLGFFDLWFDFRAKFRQSS